jgi:hypothetical protein
MKLPSGPQPAGCIFDSGRDSASFQEFLAIMQDCLRAQKPPQTVSGVLLLLSSFRSPSASSNVCAQERPPMSAVFERLERLHDDCVKNGA